MERVVACLEKLTAAEERVAVAIERLVELSRGLIADSRLPVAGRENRESRQMRAMRLLHELGPDSLTEIASRVDVHRRTLNKWPVFMEAVERMRAAEQWVPRELRARAVGEDEL